MNIDDMLVTLIGKEGKYSNHVNDTGGETCWGVTVAVARAYGYTGLMKDLPRATAESIYRARYWVQPNFDKVNTLAPAIAEELLDTGVNMGQAVAGKFLQRALNVLNDQGKLFPDVTADGNIGPMTLDALRQYLKHRGTQGVAVLLGMLNAQQSVRYMEIAEANKSQESFSYGWQANRVTI